MTTCPYCGCETGEHNKCSSCNGPLQEQKASVSSKNRNRSLHAVVGLVLFSAMLSIMYFVYLGIGNLMLEGDSRSPTPDPVNLSAEQSGSSPVEQNSSATSSLPPAPEPDKTIYAKSFINKPAPQFIVEEWLTKQPSLEGKMVLIDFWVTWCGPCIAAIPKLNQFHRNHKNRLVVIGISDETSEKVRAHTGAKINYALAIDPQKRMHKELQIDGVPHVIIIDPTGIVRWEGFPFEQGHELTEAVVDNLLDTYVP